MVAEQRQTQVLLKKAQQLLAGFYNKPESLLQASELPWIEDDKRTKKGVVLDPPFNCRNQSQRLSGATRRRAVGTACNSKT